MGIEILKDETHNTYFIADDFGHIYAHDIQTYTMAKAIISDLLKVGE